MGFASVTARRSHRLAEGFNPALKIGEVIYPSPLKISDIVIVNAGQPIPVDGMIVSGIATVDQRALTGESQPVEKGVGTRVLAEAIVLTGQICIEVEKTGKETVAAQIGEILSHTTDFKSSVQSRGQKIVDLRLTKHGTSKR